VNPTPGRESGGTVKSLLLGSNAPAGVCFSRRYSRGSGR
jgi:hypothetical protein